ncbi:transcription factor MYBS3 [Argentina anserina]|uniref:transcription factor MYBS3 n=1 Tax=Argentina anserina TaxID=57926 RepID=UPI0021764DAE|nr:transcription factor MYBS3 [Potentilla anserina]
MTRRCSHCSNNGHNSRTCPSRGGGGGASSSSCSSSGGGVRLFGVKLTDGSIIKKSASMGNLSSMASHYQSSSPNPDSPPLHDPLHVRDGYLSDDPAHASSSTNRRVDRKKGVPWTEEEHRMFLIGLQKLGKGDWRGIARNYVVTRTPTQVASHAQKYFIRQSNSNRRKRRSSLFDMAPDMAMDPSHMPDEQVLLPSCQEERESEDSNAIPSLNLSLGSECSRPMESTQEEKAIIEPDNQPVMRFNGYPNGYPPVSPGFIPAYLPFPYPVWQTAGPLIIENGGDASHHPQVLKPVPILPKEPVNVDTLVGMSQLFLGEAESLQSNPSPLYLTSLGETSRQSAFHPNPASEPDLSKGKTSVIKAV